MKFCIVLLLILAGFSVIAQGDEGDLYWKARSPNKAYWQQDVDYTIRAVLNDVDDIIIGELKLNYTNNSPDVLTELYFHVYQNAFEPGSYRNRYAAHDDSTDVYQHTSVEGMAVNGVSVTIEKDNSILIVKLPEPINSGESAQIECKFQTQFGPFHGRMKQYEQYGYKHFNVVHWYPRISVYDRKFGWTTDQHLGHEFYGDFGAFDVQITLPEEYILDGTGVLLNRSEVLPDALMQKLDIKNFADKPWNEVPSEIIPKSERTKTWKFKAKNVHDFAWTADPAYRIGQATALLENGREILCIALAQEQHASRWQNAATYAAKIIEIYSRDFGEYHYPKMIVADARDGMEYPMLTLDGGGDPRYRSLLAHEIGHNWFFGMVGNNETYRASLDEGFTQFLTAWAMIELEGDSVGVGRPLFSFNKPYEQIKAQRDLVLYDGYYYSAIMRDDSPRLNTHSDKFDSRRQYGQVYSKTGVMLYNLQYVLGDSLFLAAIQHYFDQWKFCHPYFEDFRSSIIQFTGVDLNWFFDQWLETEEDVDYGIKSFKKVGGGEYELKLERKGDMEMPIAISLIDGNDSVYEYWIPNTYFIKETDATILPRWDGWNQYNEVYTVKIATVTPIKRVSIDASERLADVYYLDNKLPLPIQVRLNNLTRSKPSRNYDVEWLPSIWYNGYDGVKFGLTMKGAFALTHHKIESGVWFNSGLGQQSSILNDQSISSDFYRFNFKVRYETPLRGIATGLKVEAHSYWLDGLAANSIGWKKLFPNGKTSLSQHFNSLYRPSDVSLNYLLYPQIWNVDKWNNFNQLRLDHRYAYGNKSRGHIISRLRSPFLWSDYSYGFINLESINENRIQKINWRTRVFGQLGAGNNWAPESQLFAASGNPEQTMDNPFTRSIGMIPTNTLGYGANTGSFQSGGGLNLRGYNNYLLPEYNRDSTLRFAFAGTSGIALNTEIEFDDIVSLAPKLRRFIELKTYLFADAGVININRTNEQLQFSSIRADAGIGAALEIKRWGRFTDLQPTTIRADFPLFLNRPPASEEFLQFRWLIAVDRAF